MRDIGLLILVFSILPFSLFRPQLGIYLWTWLSFMNPHRLTYGMAYDFPFAMLVAITTFISIFVSKCKKNSMAHATTYILLFFFLWITFTTVFSLNPEGAWTEWQRILKIQLFVFLTLLLITDKTFLDRLIWVIVLSFGYYAARGGLATLLTGATNLQGPPDTFFADNNILALAILMVMPLMAYLYFNGYNKWVKRAILGLMFLSLVSIVGSNSRGAFVASLIIGFFILLGSKRKFAIAALLIVVSVSIVLFAPESWKERMQGIDNYEEDSSALGRLNSWYFAVYLALDRPIGGGLQVFRPSIYAQYAPEPDDFHDAHSIYFEILAEQGWIGLLIFLSLWWLAYINNIKVKRIVLSSEIKNDVELEKHVFLSKMLQYSLLAYLTGGVFLGIAYFDLPYYLLVVGYINTILVDKKIKA